MASVAESRSLFTIGHSTQHLDDFIAALRIHEVTAIADVRSVPHSRWRPQFNREPLSKVLKQSDIHYVFIGVELGARPMGRVSRTSEWAGATKLTVMHSSA